MAGERFVVLGLAPARSAWFRSVALWANSGALAADFVKCLSAEEVRARLGGGQPFSALLVDAGHPSVDRDLLAVARRGGCAVLVVDDAKVRRDWGGLGVAQVLPAGFDRHHLAEALAAHARPIRRADALPDSRARPAPPAWRGSVVALTGAGGTGTSVAAIALAQTLGADVRHAGQVLLADLRRHAEQAMLHDAGDVVPGLQELVEAHRAAGLGAEQVRTFTFSVSDRRYHLLAGLRRSQLWPAIRPRAFEAAFDSLRRAYRVVVCDIDPDLEGEADCGSIDVEERHVMARTAVAQADVVFTVGLPTMKGVHALVRVVLDVLAAGVPAERVVPVFNRSPRSPAARAAPAAALAALVEPALISAAGVARLAPVVHLPDRRVDEALRDGLPVPPDLGPPLVRAWRGVVDAAGPRPAAEPGEAVRPGSLGHWAEEGVGG